MPKQTNSFILSLFVLAVAAVFTSQSLVDMSDILIVGTALFFVYKLRDSKNFLFGFKPVYLWPLWLGVVLVGLFINLNISAMADFLEFKWILSLLSIIFLVKFLENRKLLISSIAFLLLANNLISLFLFFYRNDVRAGGIYDAVMAFSHNIGPVFCLTSVFTIANWKNLNRQSQLLGVFLAFTGGLLTLLTYTRGVWIGSILAIAVSLFMWNSKRAIQVTSVLCLLVAVLVLTNQKIHDRVLAKTQSEATSNNERLSLWKANWRMIQDYPVFGVGFGQNKNHLRKYYDEIGFPADMIISHAHNQYLQLWAGTGTLGLACFLMFLFGIFRQAWKGYRTSIGENKALLLALISSLLCFTIGALTEANFNISKNRFLFLLLAGLAIGFSEKPKALQ